MEPRDRAAAVCYLIGVLAALIAGFLTSLVTGFTVLGAAGFVTALLLGWRR